MDNAILQSLRELDSRRLSRRQFVRMLGALGASAGVAVVTQGCGPRPAAVGGTLNLCVWQGYDDAEVAQPFVEANGVTINGTYIASNEECFTKERAAPGSFDAMGINLTMAETFHQADLILPVDTSAVTNWNDLIDTLRNQPYINYDGQPYLVPYIWGTTGVNYNPEFVELPETFTFRDVILDDRFTGKITFPDDPAGMLILLGLANDFENPTRISAEQLEQNVALGTQMKQRALAIGATYTDVTDMLVRGDAWLNLAGWEAVNKWAADAGATILEAYPTRSWSWSDGWMVTKNSSNAATAWAYINQMTMPESMALLAKNLFSAPSNQKAYPLLEGDVAETFQLDKLAPALAGSPILPIPPTESDEFTTMSDWQSAWERIKSA